MSENFTGTREATLGDDLEDREELGRAHASRIALNSIHACVCTLTQHLLLKYMASVKSNIQDQHGKSVLFPKLTMNSLK